jgi:hypothetical protein
LQQFRCGWLEKMLSKQTQTKTGTHPELWRVFVGFDDLRARQRALDVCEFITKQFGPDIEFDLDVCDFRDLENVDHLERSVASAAAAKIVVVSTSAHEGMEEKLTHWMDGLRNRRHGLEGVLVRLVDPTMHAPLGGSSDFGLRHLAHELGLDYLTHAPDCRALRAEAGVGTVENRSKNLGPVLEEILTHTTRPEFQI